MQQAYQHTNIFILCVRWSIDAYFPGEMTTGAVNLE